MARLRTTRIGNAVAAALAAISLTGCGLAPSAGPLQTLSVGGQPYAAMGGIWVVVGQPADAEAYVFSTAHDPVTVTGVSAVPLPGDPTGRLVHAAIEATGASIAVDRGWPPVPVRPLIGADLPLAGTGLPQGQSGIIFGLSGSQAGRAYAIAGLQIEYRYQGRSYSMTAWAGLAFCVVTAAQYKSGATVCPSFQVFSNNVNRQVEKMAGIK
jgi:hypothetical protein